MIDIFNKFKDLIIVAFLAFSLGGAVTFFPTKNHYTQKYELIAKEKEIVSERKLNEALSGARVTENNLQVEKLKITEVKDEAIKNLQKRLREHRKPSSGGTPSVYVDPGSTFAGVPNPVNTGTAEANPTNPGRLSDETREFLFEYAADAEITRLDLITCRAWNDTVKKQVDDFNLKMKSVYGVKASTPQSSDQ